jgi:hypothetical protein
MMCVSRYLSGEKKRSESMRDAVMTADQQQLDYLKELRAELKKLYNEGVCSVEKMN